MSKKDKEAVEHLWKELERERVHLGEECKGHDVEQETESCQESLTKVIGEKAKIIRICARSMRW